jgi:hypothetical protein
MAGGCDILNANGITDGGIQKIFKPGFAGNVRHISANQSLPVDCEQGVEPG